MLAISRSAGELGPAGGAPHEELSQLSALPELPTPVASLLLGSPVALSPQRRPPPGGAPPSVPTSVLTEIVASPPPTFGRGYSASMSASRPQSPGGPRVGSMGYASPSTSVSLAQRPSATMTPVGVGSSFSPPVTLGMQSASRIPIMSPVIAGRGPMNAYASLPKR